MHPATVCRGRPPRPDTAADGWAGLCGDAWWRFVNRIGARSWAVHEPPLRGDALWCHADMIGDATTYTPVGAVREPPTTAIRKNPAVYIPHRCVADGWPIPFGDAW